jgi:hypothetical protein
LPSTLYPFTVAVRPDQLAFEDHEQDEDRHGGEDRTGHDEIEGDHVRRRELFEPYLHRPVAVLVGDEQRPQVLVPRGEEGEHGERGDLRPGERHRDARQEAPVAVAVHDGGVAQVARHAEERLTDQERTEGEREERRDEPLVAVGPAEVLHRLVVGDDGHLGRHHERGEEHHEQQCAPRKRRTQRTP